jgi:UDP-galactopyranose mutase
LAHYISLAQAEKNITFMGRLGTYRYLDMHVTIAEALEVVQCYLSAQERQSQMPVFVINPLS